MKLIYSGTIMQVSAILFDLDNTLYPESSGIMNLVDTRITEYVQTTLGITYEEAKALQRQYFAEHGTTLRGLLNHHTVDPEHYLSYVHDLAIELFLASDAELDRLLGSVDATKAIFTNSSREHAQRVLNVLNIERHFAQVFDIRFFDFVPKPHPAGYQRALDRLGVTGSQTILIEDTAKNLPPASALGMTTILIAETADTAMASMADYVVPDVLAALRLILELA
jgi:putative hydrolase of the HAD superfamily